jgi:hypothetical protein
MLGGSTMAIAAGRTTTVSSSASSDWVKLKPGTNRIVVSCSSWSTSSATFDLSTDASTPVPIRDGVGSSATAITYTGNGAFDVDGIGNYIRLTVASYGSSPVTMKVLNSIDDRL